MTINTTNSERAKIMRERRSSKGLCVQCGGTNDRPSLTTCTKCSERMRVYKKQSGGTYYTNFKNKRISNKLCMNCNNLLDREGMYCAKCAKIMSSNRRSKYSQLKEQGLCVMCKEVNDNSKGVYCSKCKEKRKEEYKQKKI